MTSIEKKIYSDYKKALGNYPIKKEIAEEEYKKLVEWLNNPAMVLNNPSEIAFKQGKAKAYADYLGHNHWKCFAKKEFN